ncbi:hypothetical protein ACFV2I_36130 [Streptomyces microflavus]
MEPGLIPVPGGLLDWRDASHLGRFASDAQAGRRHRGDDHA